MRLHKSSSAIYNDHGIYYHFQILYFEIRDSEDCRCECLAHDRDKY